MKDLRREYRSFGLLAGCRAQDDGRNEICVDQPI